MVKRAALTISMACLALVPVVPAIAATDPLDAVSAINPASASPLRQITIAVADAAKAQRFFGDAVGMTPSGPTKVSAEYARPLGLKVPVAAITYTRPGVSDAASVRALIVPGSMAVLRPKHDAQAVGGLAMGMPVSGQAKREAIVAAAGFTSAVGVTRMTLPRADGAPYVVEEIHYQAPDGILVLGIDRGTMKPVGSIDATSGIGGPAYSSIVVGDLAGTGRFMTQVLGYELRRDAVFTSAGSKGGLGLPDGTRFAFQQWFAPGSSTGYVIVMKLIDRAVDPVAATGFAKRGIVMWRFDVADLKAAEARTRAAGMRVVARPAPKAASLIVAMPDGFLVELTQRADAAQ